MLSSAPVLHFSPDGSSIVILFGQQTSILFPLPPHCESRKKILCSRVGLLTMIPYNAWHWRRGIQFPSKLSGVLHALSVRIVDENMCVKQKIDFWVISNLFVLILIFFGFLSCAIWMSEIHHLREFVILNMTNSRTLQMPNSVAILDCLVELIKFHNALDKTLKWTECTIRRCCFCEVPTFTVSNTASRYVFKRILITGILIWANTDWWKIQIK